MSSITTHSMQAPLLKIMDAQMDTIKELCASMKDIDKDKCELARHVMALMRRIEKIESFLKLPSDRVLNQIQA